MTPNHPTYGARDLPKNPMTAPNDEHYVGCFNALMRDAEKRRAHREARAAAIGFEREAHTGLVHLGEDATPERKAA